MFSLFRYLRTRSPPAGWVLTLAPNWHDVPRELLRGSGLWHGQPPAALPGMQMLVPMHTMTVGLGGIQAGVIRGQQLVAPAGDPLGS